MNTSMPRVVFMGSPEFAVPSLRALVGGGYEIVAAFTQPDRPAGRGRQLTAPPVKLAAQELGIGVRQPESLRRAGAIEELSDLQPELIVVAAYGQILRPAVIDLPRFGCLNVHASLLPRHRGASCVAAAILAGDAETGVTMMQIDPGMDTGPLVAQRSTPIGADDTTGSLTDRLALLGAELLLEALPGYLSGAMIPHPQDNARATHAPLLEKQAGAIDWSKPALQLWREVRAFNPWPLSVTRLGSEALQILEAWPLPVATAVSGAPGAIVMLGAADDRVRDADRRRAGFAVVTGDGLLAPLLVRRAGRPAVTGAEFARGVRGLIGAVLG
ncbi:MAG: methionyl-tRNA formyltransferase [Dehalococcoidia bacterium]